MQCWRPRPGKPGPSEEDLGLRATGLPHAPVPVVWNKEARLLHNAPASCPVLMGLAETGVSRTSERSVWLSIRPRLRRPDAASSRGTGGQGSCPCCVPSAWKAFRYFREPAPVCEEAAVCVPRGWGQSEGHRTARLNVAGSSAFIKMGLKIRVPPWCFLESHSGRKDLGRNKQGQ